MEKEFVPYELALRLKNLGFDEPCLKWFIWRDKGDYQCVSSLYDFPIDEDGGIPAPTFSQAFRWFRKTYPHIKFHFKQSDWKGDYTPFFDVNVKNEKRNITEGCGGLLSYEDAELNCLYRLINIVEN